MQLPSAEVETRDASASCERPNWKRVILVWEEKAEGKPTSGGRASAAARSCAVGRVQLELPVASFLCCSSSSMFPSVPPLPPPSSAVGDAAPFRFLPTGGDGCNLLFLVQACGGGAPVALRRRWLFGMVMLLNVLACVLIGVSWTLSRDERAARPSGRFWRQQVAATSFWNQEQRRLDVLYNPLVSSQAGLVERPDWPNDTGPAHPCEPDHRVPLQVWDYDSLPQPFRDFLLHMHCRAFPMLMNQARACARTPFLLLAVKSLVPHFERRQAIRETWGRARTYGNQTVVTVFLLGSSSPVDHFPDLLGILGREAELHQDLLQWDYRDTFFNLTLKEVLFLEWFSQNCPRARFVLKGDDDVFVNTVQVIRFLEELPENQEEDFFIGDVISNASPQRNQTLKYFIPESVFAGQYPPYAGGGGYLLSGEVARRLYNVSWQVALYPIDDVYTGMCLEKLGIVPGKHSGFKTFGIEERYRRNPCTYRNLMLVHSQTPQEMLRTWPWVTDPGLECQ